MLQKPLKSLYNILKIKEREKKEKERKGKRKEREGKERNGKERKEEKPLQGCI